jgi:hypothetical protein
LQSVTTPFPAASLGHQTRSCERAACKISCSSANSEEGLEIDTEYDSADALISIDFIERNSYVF